MNELPKIITTPRVLTQIELAGKAVKHLIEALNIATPRDCLDIYAAIQSGDQLGLGRIMLNIDAQLSEIENEP